MEEIVWALVVSLVAMLARMSGGRRSTVVLAALPFGAPIVPYLYARFCMTGDHMGMGFVLFLGMPLAFISGTLISIAIYCWLNRG